MALPQPGNPARGAERQDADFRARVSQSVRFVNLTIAAQHGVFARAFTRKTLKIALFKCEKSPSQPTSRRARVQTSSDTCVLMGIVLTMFVAQYTESKIRWWG